MHTAARRGFDPQHHRGGKSRVILGDDLRRALDPVAEQPALVCRHRAIEQRAQSAASHLERHIRVGGAALTGRGGVAAGRGDRRVAARHADDCTRDDCTRRLHPRRLHARLHLGVIAMRSGCTHRFTSRMSTGPGAAAPAYQAGPFGVPTARLFTEAACAGRAAPLFGQRIVAFAGFG